MIGRVTYANGKIVATLDDDRSWSVIANGKPDATLARALTSRYSGEFDGPEYGSPGVMALRDLGDRVNGWVEIADRPESPDDIVY